MVSMILNIHHNFGVKMEETLNRQNQRTLDKGYLSFAIEGATSRKGMTEVKANGT